MSGLAIAGWVLLTCIIIGVIWLLTKKKGTEGDSCEGTDKHAVYKLNADLDCKMDSCITGYSLNDDSTLCELTKKEGDSCEGTDKHAIYKLNADLDCKMDSCITGYTLNDDSTLCELNKNTSPIDGLKLITDDFTDSSKLWPNISSELFKMYPGKYMEATDSDAPEDGQILGMYITEDVFVVYRRNDDSSLFKPIWTFPNYFKDSNKGEWSLKIYRNDGKMRLDGGPTGEGGPTPDDEDGNLYNGSQWQQNQSGTEPFTLATSGDCPYVYMMDNDGVKNKLIPADEYCKNT